ncbi:MAG: hypothetical protein DI551_02445 [Micavibrio aeruginosavorus]|uniref:Uncharacterized protein n=1 Tax=Micavibrio aeruginosavorus TaxID=349221 RepID=A0A2W5N315_9BACT|nr:MAG: hypothetical protein DI551_02445 [Micavibrio aeruginosavorus]
MYDTDGWSAKKKCKHSLLKRAFAENRGYEVILLMQWRTAKTSHDAESDFAKLKEFERLNKGNRRAIRALNLIEEMNGNQTVHKNAPEEAVIRSLPSFKDAFKMLADMPMEQRILYPDPMAELADRLKPLDADHYDPMDGLRITTGYDLVVRDLLSVEMKISGIRPS